MGTLPTWWAICTLANSRRPRKVALGKTFTGHLAATDGNGCAKPRGGLQPSAFGGFAGCR